MGVFDRSPVQFSKKVVKSVEGLDRVSIAGFIVMAQLFVFLSAPQLWEDEAVQNMILVYFVMAAFSFAVLDVQSPLYRVSVWDGLVQWIVSFVLGLFVFDAMGLGAGGSMPEAYGSVTLLVVLELFVVSMCEELMFRGGLPAVMQKSNMSLTQAILVSNVGFGLFHIWAYSWNLGQVVAAFFFGLLMSYFWYGGSWDSRGTGYPLVACGLHAAWNVIVLGGPFMILGGML